jgi:hypothetical protein
MAMEDSADLTSIGHSLQQAVKTGVRKQFFAIDGEEIALVSLYTISCESKIVCMFLLSFRK